MPELLIELGVEELPAFAVERAYLELADLLEKELAAANVLGEGFLTSSFGTPRRLIVSIASVLDRQPDATKEQRGPGVAAAYAEDGAPTKALLGFCKSQGVEPAELRNDGQYVWITKKIEGRPAGELLAEVVPKSIRALTFDKTMRWGSGRMRFARPIRWILASLGGTLVRFELEGVVSGLQSFGHRFYAPEAFEARSLGDLLGGLRQRFVEPDADIRRKVILEQSRSVVEGQVELDEPLVDENVFLTEWPTPIAGSFGRDFLELPEPVLITAMAKHERMFPVRGSDGELTNQFVFVRNSGQDASVRSGSEWVLNARFNDAQFFFDEDKKTTLDEFRDLTSGILFAEGLGSVLERSARLEKLSEIVASDACRENLVLAARYSKADLATGLVGEMASLQGIIGSEYARREGLPEPTCWAIAHQYNLAFGAAGEGVARETAIRLVMVDQIDKLAGYGARGLMPTGSSDPYALRRAASLVIEAAWLLGEENSFRPWLEAAGDLYMGQGYEISNLYVNPARLLIANRYKAVLPDVRHDILEAVLSVEGMADDPVRVLRCVRATEELAKDRALVQTLTRPVNIVRSAIEKGIPYRTDEPLFNALDSESGALLFNEYLNVSGELTNQLQPASLEKLRGLRPLINRYFEETMMMVDDLHTRTARLNLNSLLARYIMTLADVSKIVIEA